jgi:thiamine pyrophosphokinase
MGHQPPEDRRSVVQHVLVVTGGGPLPPDVLTGRTFDAVVAADSGLDAALALGLRPDLLVGDLDSISDQGRRWAISHDLPVEEHPVDKDHTDTALALRSRLVADAQRVTLATPSATGRLDHLLGTLGALGDPILAHHLSITALVDRTVAHVLHPGHEVTLELAAGRVFSLLALHGGCVGVDVSGGHWPLTDATLPAGTTRGISNLAIGTPESVHVRVRAGVLSVVVPPEEAQ